jgi:hypothetical protein
MRKNLIAFSLLIIASPALAQEAPPQLPPELTDPATVHRLAGTLQTLSRALLDLKVGEVRAGLEGRTPTPAERNLTVRDMARQKDPDFDRHLEQKIAAAGPQIERNMAAMQRALPQMMRSLHDVQKSLERAMANMPDPTYPKR